MEDMGMGEVEPRALELSDLASAEEAEIQKNPFRFLNLPPNASPEDSRAAYIRLSKGYHPFLIGKEFDKYALRRCFQDEEFHREGLGSLEQVIAVWEGETTSIGQREKIMEGIKVIATKRLASINRAYHAIKERYAPSEWIKIFGYESKRIFDDEEGVFTREIDLEGQAKVVVYDDHWSYFVKGPYLCFDFGECMESYGEPVFRRSIPVRHLFAKMELNDGKQVSPALINPFIECFHLSEQQTALLQSLMKEKMIGSKKARYIMDKLGIPNIDQVDSRKDEDRWFYGHKFELQLNQIMFLTHSPDHEVVWLSQEGGTLTLEPMESGTQTNLSEADVILLTTLAYGPLLR